MRLKPGVSVYGLRPEIVIALIVADAVYDEHGVDMVMTSGSEGRHGWGSLHFQGLAVDLRTHNLEPADRPIVAEKIKTRLGAEYDVVHKNVGKPNEHIHIEYHRKTAGG